MPRVVISPVRLLAMEWILAGVIQISAQIYFARAIYLCNVMAIRKKIWFPVAIVRGFTFIKALLHHYLYGEYPVDFPVLLIAP
ncbi:hypothetical protein BD779DRAFT_1542105 [Infundibulicybe gibba]|nr:hypothetical protein BD779DRAFT_1542105 [Infundibulicybe gibba]